MKATTGVLVLTSLAVGSQALLRRGEPLALSPEQNKELAELQAKNAKEIVDAKEEQLKEISQTIEAARNSSEEEIIRKMSQRQEEAIKKLEAELPYGKKRLWEAWRNEEKGQLNLTMHDIMDQREKEYKVMDGIKDEADHMNKRHVAEIGSIAGQVAHVLAHNAAGQEILAARQQSAALQEQVKQLRTLVTQGYAAAVESAHQTLRVARETRGLTAKMPPELMAEIQQLAGVAEQQAIEMQDTIVHVRQKANQAEIVANAGAATAKQAAEMAQQAEAVAVEARDKARINAQRLADLQQQANQANLDAVKAQTDSKTASSRVGA